MPFGLIIVGDEILSGKRADKHLPKVIALLGARGLSLSWARYVGDDRSRITEALRHAFASGDVVFSCGGIGATPDDHTRQCAAAALERPLALHPRARELILERMQDVGARAGRAPASPTAPDNVHRLNMGVFPEGAQIIPNPYNKIPGFSVGDVHFVPGFPVMAWPMIESVLDQRYAHLHGSAAADRALGDRLRRDGSRADAADGSDRARPSAGVRCSACRASIIPSAAATSSSASRGPATPTVAAYAALRAGACERWARSSAPKWCDEVARDGTMHRCL